MSNTALRISGNVNDASDILQDSFVDMFLKLDSFRMESSFGAWFKRIVVNKSLNHLRKSRMVSQEAEDLSELVAEEESEAPFEYDIRYVKKGSINIDGRLPTGINSVHV
ncbi:MAG: RNA polymerase sigma factor (sigma-70 family) [Flammeovirgaceae bacterium]|jgi:RNA polymerase sigma factor (sigma-70 family)